jgi:ferredoxin
MHPTVQLAALLIREQAAPAKPGLLGPDDFALERAKQNPKELLTEAAQIQKRFAIGSSIFGAWIGLVIGVKLINLSIRRQRTDYEPDRGSCLACTRCFESCPNELVRRGLTPASATPVSIAPAGS